MKNGTGGASGFLNAILFVIILFCDILTAGDPVINQKTMSPSSFGDRAQLLTCKARVSIDSGDCGEPDAIEPSTFSGQN